MWPICCNKCDSVGAPDPEFYEFYNLGMGDPIAVSAVHGHGTGDLLDAVIAYFPPESEEEEEDDTIKVAVIGKPNVGKSSLINRISGQERAIVSDIAGTTRDATDTRIENQYGKFTFIDTAGIRRKSKVTDAIEKYSIIRARTAVERANVCVIMIDATEGFTEQDSKVAGIALDQGKGCIVVVNKWDAVEKDGNTMREYKEKLAVDFAFMKFAPFVFISAKTGQRVDRLFEPNCFISLTSGIWRTKSVRCLVWRVRRYALLFARGERAKNDFSSDPGCGSVLFTGKSEFWYHSFSQVPKGRCAHPRQR